jgi:CRP-like cAMP-binding protein
MPKDPSLPPDLAGAALAAPEPLAGETRDAQYQALYALIAQHPFFMGMIPRHLQQLAEAAIQLQFEEGENIFAEGSPANRFYLILKGKVVLEAEMADRTMIAVQTLGPGDDLGWSWLFPPYSMHFSARALEPTTTIFFYGTRLREQCEEDHELGYQLMKRIAEVATKCLHATQAKLMEYIDKHGLSRG